MAETETGWTKGIPAKSGWYFMRNEAEGVITDGMIVWVGYNQSGVRHEGEFIYASHPWLKGREFRGPLLLPDFEQLTRLRESASDALRFMEWNADPTTSNYPAELASGYDIIAALRAALAQPKGEQS